MLVPPSLSGSGEDGPHLHCPVLACIRTWPSTANVSQSRMKTKSHCLSCLCLIYSAMWRWLKQSVAAYRKPEQKSETPCRPEPIYMSARIMCGRGKAETIRSLRRTNSFAALHKVAREAGSSFGPWPVFSASLAFCLALVASTALERKPRLSSRLSFLMGYIGVSCAFHSAYISEGETGKFLPSPLSSDWLLRNLRCVSFGYFCWCSSKVGFYFLLDLQVLAWCRQAGCFVTYIYWCGDSGPMVWTRRLLCYAMNPTKWRSLHSMSSPVLLLLLERKSQQRSQSYLMIHIQYLLENSQLPQC